MSSPRKLTKEEKEQLLNSNLTISVKQLMAIMDMSENPTYAAIKNGQFRSIRVGNIIKIPTAPLKEMLQINGGAK